MFKDNARITKRKEISVIAKMKKKNNKSRIYFNEEYFDFFSNQNQGLFNMPDNVKKEEDTTKKLPN